MTLAPGTRLGPYEILAPLGAGGMGEVYRARDSRLGRDVALKLLPAGFERDPERLARFEREARAVAGLSHPNIVVLHSIEQEGGRRFLTMEVVEGESLDRAMTPGGLPLPRVLELAVALSAALVAAHEKGVVHRDLKPANVMLTRDGRLKVLDFGLAKVAEASSGLDLSAALTMDSPVSSIGQVVGTVPYMAPEQLRGDSADARTDIFAFGVLVYELAAGRRPFTGETAADVSSAILRDAPPALSAVRPGLPPDLERIVTRCLEKDPPSRFPSALELHNELRRVRRETQQGGAPAPAKPAAQEAPSVAVLPFVNMSRDEENEYFSDGLAEELLNVLSKIRGLRVAARSSSFTFKGKGSTVAEVGKALGVATVLEGSVRKAGNRIRISVQLVKVEDGFHVWSETYDRMLDDIFAVQDDIAQAVVKELRTTLLGGAADSNASGEARAEVAAAAKGRATSGESHRLFLQGLYLVNRFTPSDFERGLTYLKEAVAQDPANARAWAAISWTEGIRGNMGSVEVEEAYVRARAAARRALELEPDLAEAHMAMGNIACWYDWDWVVADAEYRRALELAPGNSEVLRAAAMLCYSRGRMDEALGMALRAVEQDPLAPIGHHCLGRIHRVMGRFAESDVAFRRALDIAPGGFASTALLALTLMEAGRLEQAIALAETEQSDWARLFSLAALHHRAGHAEEADRMLRELTEARSRDAAFQIAAVHAFRGESDAAFEWLERACAQRDSGLTLVRMEPLFRSVHADPRWQPFLRKMKLAD